MKITLNFSSDENYGKQIENIVKVNSAVENLHSYFVRIKLLRVVYVSINRGNAAVTKVAAATVVVTSCRSEIICSPAFPSLSEDH
jgi:microcystin degradation protein MlrC